MSIYPPILSACLAASGIFSGILRSRGKVEIEGAFGQRAATRCNSASRRAERITRAPPAANCFASASPIPLDAPVIQTIFPVNFDGKLPVILLQQFTDEHL